MGQLKVLQVVPRIHAGGVESYLLDLTKELTRLYKVRCYVASFGGKLKDSFEENNVTVFEGPFHKKNPLSTLLNAFRLFSLIKIHKINIIHVHSRAPAWYCLIASKLCNVPVISTYHGVYSHNNFFKRLYNLGMVLTDKTIAISHYIEAHIKKVYPRYSDKTITILEGIDLEKFNPALIDNKELNSWKKKLSIKEKDKIIALVGRFSPIKGHFTALKVLKELHAKDHSHIHLLFVGEQTDFNAPYREDLNHFINTAKLNKYVHFIQNWSMPVVYSLADVVLSLTVKPEAFGRVAVEAIAMERPVIGGDLGATPEVLGPMGMLVPPTDAQAIAEQIISLFRTPKNEMEEMLQAQKKHVTEHYDLQQMIEKTFLTYQALLAS